MEPRGWRAIQEDRGLHDVCQDQGGLSDLSTGPVRRLTGEGGVLLMAVVM
jgi:hypothetical protein